MTHLFANYKRQPVAFSYGRGCELYDHEGRSYLDFLSGIAVNCLGHSHPALVEALTDQVGKLLHVSNLYEIPEQSAVADRLSALSGLDKVFFCNSGTEANEAAIKLARRHHAAKGGSQPRILSASHGFHGRTLGALAATGTPDYHKGFEPLPPGFQALPYNDLAAFQQAWGPDVAAVLLEPLQGEGGIIPGAPHFLEGVQALCREHKALLILDEVQTGIGRTGTMFAFQQAHVQPDLVTLAKGLGAGLPIGALLARADLADLLGPGSHGCTFGGNPLSCRAALVALEQVEPLLGAVRLNGLRLRQGLEQAGFANVRGLGLLVGADCADAARMVELCRGRGLLVNAVRPTSLRLAPPLIVSQAEIDRAVTILAAARADLEAERQAVVS